MSSEHINAVRPLFDTETVTINFLSNDPNGFNFEAGASLGRTEQLTGAPSFKQDEATQLKEGMKREAAFSGAQRLRELRNAYLHPKEPITDEERAGLRATYANERSAYQQRGKKAGLVAITQTGENTLSADVKVVPFPVYRDFATYEASDDLRTMSRVAGVAAIVRTTDNRLIIQHRAVETVKLHEPGKTPGNAAYSDQPGASVAGIMDASLRGKERKPGTPDPITTETIQAMVFKEAGEELGLAPEDLGKLRLVGVASDKVKPHDELLLLADSKLDARGVYETSKHSSRNKNLSEIDLDEKFFDIEATPAAIETLLCDVRCPLPPTHAAALVAAGYLMKVENDGVEEAIRWRTNLERRFGENYKIIDDTVRHFYDNFPRAALQVPERYWGKTVPPRDPMGYDPRYTPEEQGLPTLEDEMVRTGLTPEKRKIVPTTYLFDVDGVLKDPEQAHVTEEAIFEELNLRLSAGIPVGFNTGRSTQWVIDHLITPLLERSQDKSILQSAIVIGEKGAAWALFNDKGDPQFGSVESLGVPPKLHQKIMDLAEGYSDAMGVLDPKATMLSFEMKPEYGLQRFRIARKSFLEKLHKLMEDPESGDTSEMKVDATTIATDIENRNVGKALGADRFLEFLKLRGFKAQHFITFGDSLSDIAMADELGQRGHDVSMVYVGNNRNHRVSFNLTVLPDGYSRATSEFLRTHREI